MSATEIVTLTKPALIPRNGTPIEGIEERGFLPIREWSGGIDLRGTKRTAGYVIVDKGMIDAYVFRYAYETKDRWTHRRVWTTEYMGRYPNTENGIINARDAVQYVDWDESGRPTGQMPGLDDDEIEVRV